MLQVLGLRKIADTHPQEYELRLKDLENTKLGYVQTTEIGTESDLRAMLKNGGITEPNIDLIFKQTS